MEQNKNRFEVSNGFISKVNKVSTVRCFFVSSRNPQGSLVKPTEASIFNNLTSPRFVYESSPSKSTQNHTMKQVLTVKDAAEEMGVHPNTVINRIHDGLLPYYRTKPKTGHIRFKRIWIEKFLKQKGGEAYGR